jgi:biopolymer transport protein ExbB/TolQ
VIGLQKMFSAVVSESTDPASRARGLAEGISIWMNCTIVALVVWVPSLLALLVIIRGQEQRSR